MGLAARFSMIGAMTKGRSDQSHFATGLGWPRVDFRLLGGGWTSGDGAEDISVAGTAVEGSRMHAGLAPRMPRSGENGNLRRQVPQNTSGGLVRARISPLGQFPVFGFWPKGRVYGSPRYRYHKCRKRRDLNFGESMTEKAKPLSEAATLRG